MDFSNLPFAIETELVPVTAGHVLEVDIYTPKEAPGQIAILCHPWSWLGGCKDDPVLVNLAVVFAVNLGAKVFVPNSRAVGKSTGRSSFSGQAEAKDLENLVQWGIQGVENIQCLTIVGYSHGSLLASCHPVLPSIPTHHILLSYPLSPLPWLTFFHGSIYRGKLAQLLSDPQAQVLIVYGDQDQFTARNKYTAWAAELRSTSEQINNKVEIKLIPGGDHFWRGQFNKLMRETIANWLEEKERSNRLSS